jgi:hypothetical protein
MAKRKKTTGQTTQWPKEKRQQDRQHNLSFLLAIVLSVLLPFFFWALCCLSCCLFSFGHCVVCPVVFFLLKTTGQTTQWPKEKRQKDRQYNGQKKKDKRTDNTMAKRKKTKGQTTQWPKEKRQKDRQHNGKKKKDKRTDFLLAIVLSVLLPFFFWALCCLSCCLFSFGHCVVCPVVFFLLAIVLRYQRVNQNSYIEEEQTTQWPKEKRQKDRQHNGKKKKDKRTDNTMAKRKKTTGQTTQWPKEKRQKDRQYNGQKKKDNRTDNTMANRYNMYVYLIDQLIHSNNYYLHRLMFLNY